MNYIDLPRDPSVEGMQAIQDKCNEIVRNNLPITVETLKNVKEDNLPRDYDQEKGNIRVIKIGEIDSNAYEPLDPTFSPTNVGSTDAVELICLKLHTSP